MPDRGQKWTCKSCEAAFYDLGKKSPRCPKCGLEVVVKNRKVKPRAANPIDHDKSEADGNNANIWIIAVSERDAKSAVISGPDSIDLSGIKKKGWYFFNAEGQRAKTVLSADTAVRLSNPPRIGMRKFLESRHFKGIGPEIAQQIVDLDKENPFSAISKDATEIAKETGLSQKAASDFLDSWKSNRGISSLQVLLRELEFGAMAVSAISDEFGAQIISKMLKDPYRLVRELPRFTFKDAERLIRHINLELTDDYRMASTAEYILFDREKRYGHTSAPLNRVARETAHLMQNFSEPQIEACIIEADDKFVVRDIRKRQQVATIEAAEKDQTIAETLFKMVRGQDAEKDEDRDVIFGQNLKLDYELSEEQKSALKLAVTSPVALITGGPGTGKSTMVGAIVRTLADMDHTVHLCAPTGRAAKRLAADEYLREKIGPTTIHMLLAKRREQDKASIDVLIIDEASMIDINLMVRVCDKLNDDSRLILIGDADQLPPVDPGQVFKDLLSSNVLPKNSLTGNYRQASQSSISTVAQQVIAGKMPNLEITSVESDFEFIDEKNEDRLQDRVLLHYHEHLRSKYG
jgi:exodeoxyribonuclease V alpha subunit